MENWKIEEQEKRGITIKDEEYQLKKNSYLDFLHHLYFTPSEKSRVNPQNLNKIARR